MGSENDDTFSFATFWNTKQIGFNFATFLIFHFFRCCCFFVSALVDITPLWKRTRTHSYNIQVDEFNRPIYEWAVSLSIRTYQFSHNLFILSSLLLLFDRRLCLLELQLLSSTHYHQQKSNWRNLKWKTCPDIHNGKC